MELKEYRLGDVADIISGVSYTPSDITTNGIRILRGGNVQNGNILCKEDDVFLPLSYANKDNQIHKYDTVIVSSTGSIEALAKAATCFDDIPNTQIGAFLRLIRPKEPKYAMLVSMWCTSQHFRNYIINQAKGTSINNIRTDFLTDYKILIPPCGGLQKISDLYLTINAKISLCREMNTHLESLARQIYQYWFLQFQYPNATQQLTYNPILKQPIPNGWEVKTLGEVANIRRGSTITEADANTKGNIKVVAAATTFSYMHDTANRSANIITISSSGANAGFMNFWREPIYASDCITVQCDNDIDTIFLYQQLSLYRQFIMSKARGSAQPHVYPKDIENLPIICAPKNIKEKIGESFLKWSNQIAVNDKEITALTHQRDELLPLLMNGQVVLD